MANSVKARVVRHQRELADSGETVVNLRTRANLRVWSTDEELYLRMLEVVKEVPRVEVDIEVGVRPSSSRYRLTERIAKVTFRR